MYLFGTRKDAAPYRSACLPVGIRFLPLYADDEHKAIDDTAWALYKERLKDAAIIMLDPADDTFGNLKLRPPNEPDGVKNLKGRE